MTISRVEICDNSYSEIIRQEILAFGGGELEIWRKSAAADEGLLDLLFDWISAEDQRLAWRSAWIIDTASEDFPDLLADKIPMIIKGLLSAKSGSLKRHFTRILCRYPIPEEYLGVIVNRSFELLAPSEPIAVRVFALQLLFNITQTLPDLKGELISVIESLMDEGGSAGFINRSTKLLRQLRN